MNSKVFVVQDSGKNLSPAREHGDLEILTHRDAGNSAANLIRLERKLDSFTHRDFLLLIGSPVLIGFAMHLILRKHGVVNCLVWDKDHYCYNIETVKN